MAFYISVFMCVGFISFLGTYSHSKLVISFFSSLSMLILFIVAGFRNYSVGSDSWFYTSLFNNSENLQVSFKDFFSSRIELGFFKYVTILHNINGNYIILFSFSAMITLLCWWVALRDLSPNFFLSLGIYTGYRLYTFSMSNLRQTMAMGFVIMAYCLMKKNRKIYAILLFILAVSFHLASMIFILFYLIRNIKMNFKAELLMLISTLIITVLFTSIFSKISILFVKYSAYSDTTYVGSNMNLSGIVNTLILGSVFVFGEYMYKKRDYDDVVWGDMRKLVFIAVLLSVLAFKATIMNRLVYFFSMFIVIYIPIIVESIKNKYYRIVVTFILWIAFFVYNIAIIYILPEWNTLLPFYFYNM